MATFWRAALDFFKAESKNFCTRKSSGVELAHYSGTENTGPYRFLRRGCQSVVEASRLHLFNVINLMSKSYVVMF